MKNAKQNPGRPSKKKPEVVTKLLAAFSKGFSITEACAYSEISRETFYRWLDDDQDFYDKIQQAKAKLNIRAKEVLIEAIDSGDLASARWWLARYDSSQENTQHLSTNSKLLQELIQIKEGIISNRYRRYLYIERERLLNEEDLKRLSYFVHRIDRLLQLSDSKLAEYAELEVLSLGTDKANISDDVMEAVDYRAIIKKEADIIGRSGY